MLLDLDPVIFTVGPFAVRWYGLFMAISMSLGLLYLVYQGTRDGLDEDFLLNLGLIVIVAGVVGARLIFVLTNFPSWFIEDPVRVLRVDQGGLAWHGGLLGGFLAGLWYLRRTGKMDRLRLLADLTVPGLAFGYMLVRVANIFNQEVLGRTTELGFDRWPAQLVGSAIGLILLVRFFYLAYYAGKRPPDGYQFWSFIFYHQLLRAVVEETVRDNPLYLLTYVNPQLGFGFLTLTQITTPPILLLAWYYMRRSQERALVDERGQ